MKGTCPLASFRRDGCAVGGDGGRTTAPWRSSPNVGDRQFGPACRNCQASCGGLPVSLSSTVARRTAASRSSEGLDLRRLLYAHLRSAAFGPELDFARVSFTALQAGRQWPARVGTSLCPPTRHYRRQCRGVTRGKAARREMTTNRPRPTTATKGSASASDSRMVRRKIWSTCGSARASQCAI